jgi:hypothetical protein
MNNISKQPISELGYNFIDQRYIPEGQDEYYLRNLQNPDSGRYRSLTPEEISELIANGNTSDNWSNVKADGAFNASLIQRCKFYGLVRIGKLEPLFLEFNNLRMPVGLYNSTIISCDIGDNAAIDNVNFLSHYIIGNETMLVNINEVACTDHAKFGNGILKKGEKESVRIWVELCNENAGRSVLAFDGMQAGDAWLWTRFRSDDMLMEKLKEFTEKKFDDRRGYYGTIGDRTVIKNTRIIKDVKIGSDAYIKGANKLKNLTINSSASARSQIGEGCELVNGIIGYGCRVFYGVKAVRFMLASHSQLKYGARLINSYLGDNSTISCCEVLNSLIFPAHEQHHNNSFLCASLVMGQSNMAAGATIGSNHNSRGADGELIAGRGFWPGLCVSLKHNSRFASFNLIAKGDFPAELDIPIPFSLISNDISKDRLVIMPAYWFMYNMYALERNSGKYAGRDKRSFKNQYLEYDYLAPDSINEIIDSLRLMAKAVGESRQKSSGKKINEEESIRQGIKLLEQKKDLSKYEIYINDIENSHRQVQLVKVTEAYHIFKELVTYYSVMQLAAAIERENIKTIDELIKLCDKPVRNKWINIGGQLLPADQLSTLTKSIHDGKINSWDQVHEFYHRCSDEYPLQKLKHAFACLLGILDLKPAAFTTKIFLSILQQAVATREWMVDGMYESRAKDYENPFRQMTYETQEEMEKVTGSLKNNAFILQQQEEFKNFKGRIKTLASQFKIKK